MTGSESSRALDSSAQGRRGLRPWHQARELWTKARDLYAKIGLPHMAKQMQEWLDELPPACGLGDRATGRPLTPALSPDYREEVKGERPAISDEEILARLLALNLDRAGLD